MPSLREAQKLTQMQLHFQKKTFNLNCDIGNVDKYHEGNRSLANIILIQDIHCDFSAQYNISKIIDHLSRFYKTNRNINRSLVLIEGDSGKISLDFFSSFPDPETRKNVFASFMKRGLVKGSEYYALTSDNFRTKVIGVESPVLYLDDLKVFREGHAAENIDDFFKNLNANIKILEEKLFNRDLLELARDSYRFLDKNEGNTAEFVKFIMQKINLDENQFKNLYLLKMCLEDGLSQNIETIENEYNALISELEINLKEKEKTRLIEKTLAYKLSKISEYDYFIFLEKYISAKQDRNIYTALARYISYVKQKNRIDGVALSAEINKSINKLLLSFTRTKEEKLVLELKQTLSLLKKTSGLMLSRSDYNLLSNNPLMMDPEKYEKAVFRLFAENNCDGFIKTRKSVIDNAKEKMQICRDFYRLALKREKEILNNVFDEIKKNNAELVFLVMGGFHTEGIEAYLLKKRNPYAIITPRINGNLELSSEIYLKLMTNRQLNVQKSNQ